MVERGKTAARWIGLLLRYPKQPMATLELSCVGGDLLPTTRDRDGRLLQADEAPVDRRTL